MCETFEYKVCREMKIGETIIIRLKNGTRIELKAVEKVSENTYKFEKLNS